MTAPHNTNPPLPLTQFAAFSDFLFDPRIPTHKYLPPLVLTYGSSVQMDIQTYRSNYLCSFALMTVSSALMTGSDTAVNVQFEKEQPTSPEEVLLLTFRVSLKPEMMFSPEEGRDIERWFYSESVRSGGIRHK
ncbi:hypothetical protein AVEN_191090-1 [Araneus ventricosus]|uniref:Uncharacterized protein n=1 Tax=Araneus ventricosus TaxID=182803 RepID=A0A4Y2AXP6_ARAVE|nr:hypothetical protein AVEN_191090-1 [Araneus ventricosus]